LEYSYYYVYLPQCLDLASTHRERWFGWEAQTSGTIPVDSYCPHQTRKTRASTPQTRDSRHPATDNRQLTEDVCKRLEGGSS
jgi:hypothetical protein